MGSLDEKSQLSELNAQRMLVRVYEVVLAGAPFAESLKEVLAVLSESFPDFRAAYSTIDSEGHLIIDSNNSADGMPAVAGMKVDLNSAPDFLAALRNGTVLVVPDVRCEEVLAPLRSEFVNARALAVIELPIFSTDALVGLLCIDSPDPYAWKPHEVSMLTQISYQLRNLHLRQREHAANIKIAEALRESEGRFRQIVEHINVVVWMTDPLKSEMIYVSPAYEMVWGRSCEDLYERPMTFVEAIHPEDRAHVLKAMPYQARGTYDIYYRVVRPDLTTRWIRDRAYPVKDENGFVYRIVGVAEDVTVQKLLESDLMEAKNEADKLAAVKADFLAVMSHEIRTPLNGVVGLADLLLDTNLDADQKDLAESIISSGKLLSSIVNDILDFSKLEAHRAEIEAIAFTPRKVVELLLSRFGPDLKRKGIQVVVEVSDRVPQSLLGDPTRYEQIVSNLVSNAIKFTPSGIIRISLDAQVQGNQIQIETSVQDCGIGIPPDKIKYLFEPFTQVDATTARRFGGTGLGLAICKRLVSAMGGEISVTSTPGEGACFRFTIQCESDGNLVCTEATSLPIVSHGLGTPVGSVGTILLVEDNLVNQKVASRILEKSGFSVRIAGSGAQALELFESEDFALILMDCNMPDMDGFEVTRRIRESRHKQNTIPVIALTAMAMPGDKELCLSAGMTDYLSKPINALELKEKVRALLGL